ncbi:unnamed protein product [Mytilus edulis]|uniref:Cadherin domain-containing protein n=1 Tax=Mytilus edulis TaxID=6550 RepID=A0A8S3Q6H9_MYTED|nr:unnamed protein product [Mytilus edulis]
MITQVKAVDLDETGPNSQLSYRIKSGNEQDVFMIGSTTGKIYLKRTYEITSDKMFPLNIVVNDNGKIKLNSSETLRIVLLFANMTTAAQDSGSGNRNIIISIVVIALTVVISAAMIAIILILRYKDKQDKQQSQKPLTYPQITPHEKLMANGLSKDMDMQLKKKKEVSFSIDEDLDNMELYNTSSTTASGFNDFEVHHNFDNISELSDEATNSDSGHGSSDVDITNQSNGAQSDKFAPKSVRLQPVLSAKCQSPIRADDVLTIVTNNGHRNSFDNSHRSLILDGRKKSDKTLPRKPIVDLWNQLKQGPSNMFNNIEVFKNTNETTEIIEIFENTTKPIDNIEVFENTIETIDNIEIFEKSPETTDNKVFKNIPETTCSIEVSNGTPETIDNIELIKDTHETTDYIELLQQRKDCDTIRKKATKKEKDDLISRADDTKVHLTTKRNCTPRAFIIQKKIVPQ